MNRGRKLIRNIIIIIVLLTITVRSVGIHLSPVAAHKQSEKSIHYGPSEIIHIEDMGDYQYLLCKYDKWVSCNTVNRMWLFFWRFGNQPIGFENDLSKGIDWSGSYSSDVGSKIYGSINDKRIEKVELRLDGNHGISQAEENKPDSIIQTEFYEDLFLFVWNDKDYSNDTIEAIVGYDENDNVVYEEEVP